MIEPDVAEATIMTPRLVLEPIVPAHAAEMFAGLSDPALYTYVPQSPPASIESVRARFALWARRSSPDGEEAWLNWLVRWEGAACGYVQTTLDAKEARVGYVIFSAFQGRGFAREATGAMIEHLQRAGVRDFAATVDPRNVASVAVIESLGFAFVRLSPSTDGSEGDEAEYRRVSDLGGL